MQLIQDIDYRIKGYYREEVYDSNGDVSQVNFYRGYNEETQEYSNLIVSEQDTVTRDTVLGIPNKIVKEITWFKSDGKTMASKTIEKIVNGTQGQEINQHSRSRLVTKAQGYLLQEVGKDNTQDFHLDVMQEREAYIAGSKQPLLDAISSSAKTYLTQEIKDTLTSILNVQYT
jgi:hypothetical protein